MSIFTDGRVDSKISKYGCFLMESLMRILNHNIWTNMETMSSRRIQLQIHRTLRQARQMGYMQQVCRVYKVSRNGCTRQNRAYSIKMVVLSHKGTLIMIRSGSLCFAPHQFSKRPVRRDSRASRKFIDDISSSSAGLIRRGLFVLTINSAIATLQIVSEIGNNVCEMGKRVREG